MDETIYFCQVWFTHDEPLDNGEKDKRHNGCLIQLEKCPWALTASANEQRLKEAVKKFLSLRDDMITGFEYTPIGVDRYGFRHLFNEVIDGNGEEEGH